MKFLFETTGGVCQTPEQWTLTQGLEFLIWLNTNDNIKLPQQSSIEITELTTQDPATYDQWRKDRICPIGCLEFVHRFYRAVYGFELAPINIPEQLAIPKYLNRPYYITDPGKKKAMPNLFGEAAVYLKSREKVRHIFNGRYPEFEDVQSVLKTKVLNNGTFQATGELNFVSEWRCFVLESKRKQIRCYSGDEWTLPSKTVLDEMIETYTDCPPAYTLDVGVDHDGKTSVIECHDFYSVGLYGYADYALLPFMYWRSHLARLQKQKEQLQ